LLKVHAQFKKTNRLTDYLANHLNNYKYFKIAAILLNTGNKQKNCTATNFSQRCPTAF